MLTVLLQVRYHREKDKHKGGTHKPGSQQRCMHSGNSNSSNKVRGEHGRYKRPLGMVQVSVNPDQDLEIACRHVLYLWHISSKHTHSALLDCSTIGFHFCQCNCINPLQVILWPIGINHTVTPNDHELCFSQLKVCMVYVYCSLCLLKLYLIRICNFVIEVDDLHIKGMITNPWQPRP